MIALLLGCHTDRARSLERRVESLRESVSALNTEAAELQVVLDAFPPPGASVRHDNDPPGFDPAKPLPAPAPGRPDVILLSIDTLRADHLGAYGYERDTSPFIDSLAATGVLFEDAWSPSSWTLPSHTTMLSGWLPIHHGTIEDHLSISSDVPLVQEAFQAAGYRTAGVVATLFVSSRFGFDRGFHQFHDFGIRDKETNNLSTVDADHVFHHALDWAQDQPPGQPMFLFLHVYDAHYQYDPPAPWNEKFDRKPRWGDEPYKNYTAYLQRMIPKVQLDHQIAQYDEEIAFTDAMLREFLERWRSQRDAVVVVTADHGEEFGERGSWGHAHTLWPEQLEVPLIVNGPGVPTARVSTRVGTEDIAPTVAALANVPFPSAKDGVERVTELRGGPAAADHVAARFADTSRFDTLVYRWHEPPYDLIVDVSHGVRALCDLAADPRCAVNAYGAHREEAEGLFTELMGWLGQPWQATAAGKVQVTEGVIFQDGVRRNDALEVGAGVRFAVEPRDAVVRFSPKGGAGQGPWQAFGGTVPADGCGVSFTGRFTIDNQIEELTSEESAMLTALGYLQDTEGEVEDRGPVMQGPAPCR
ncbi:MAG: sulfatase [Myxococcota bacterium]